MNDMNKEKIKKFLIVDFSKRLTLGDQLKIMFEILFVSWILFTLVYIVVLVRGHSDNGVPSSAETSQVSEVSTVEPSQEQEPSETSVEQKISNVFKETDTVSLGYDEIYKGDLILVNKQYPCHSDGEGTIPLMGVKSDSYMATDYAVSLNENIIGNLDDMLDDFFEIYGESEVMIACGYRSRSNQEEIFANEVEEVGEEEAVQWVARPGYSEHQTGLVFDFTLYNDSEQGSLKYDGTGIYSWINENSYKYGFILRYPLGKEEITGYNYESWHFRYVGLAASYYINANGLTLEEYIQTVQKHKIDDPLLIDGGGENKWYVYYVPANENQTTQVIVPTNVKYTVSGDNFSGFIVTSQVDIKG